MTLEKPDAGQLVEGGPADFFLVQSDRVSDPPLARWRVRRVAWLQDSFGSATDLSFPILERQPADDLASAVPTDSHGPKTDEFQRQPLLPLYRIRKGEGPAWPAPRAPPDRQV